MSDARDSNPLVSLKKFVFLLAYRKSSRDKIDPRHALKVLEAVLEASSKNGISDEELAIKFDYSQSEVRRILHILYDNNLAKFRRGRHPQHGATRYYWFMDLSAVNRALLARKKGVLAKLKRRLEYEKSNTFYYCTEPERGRQRRTIQRYTMDEAFSLNFECPDTGEPMEEFDNSKYIEILEKYVKMLEEEIARDEKALHLS